MTLTVISPTELEAAARALIEARRTNLGIEVTMLVVYPTGQMVTVVITVADGDYLVHDAGQGAMCLTSAGARLSAQLERRLVGIGEALRPPASLSTAECRGTLRKASSL